VTNISGIVHLKGAIATSGTNPIPFTLPGGDRPASTVIVPVDLNGGTAGSLTITPSGQVYVYPEQSVSDEQAFTGLDGVSFAASGSSFTKLTLQSGWTNYGSGTASPGVRSISGIVHLEGAMSTTGTNPLAFTLPVGDRPAHNVWVSVDLAMANRGQILIAPNGQVTVFPEGSVWNNTSFTFTRRGLLRALTPARDGPLTRTYPSRSRVPCRMAGDSAGFLRT
jgi:hypothetical protein